MPDDDPLTDDPLTSEPDVLEARELLSRLPGSAPLVSLISEERHPVRPTTPTAWRLVGLILLAGFLILLLLI